MIYAHSNLRSNATGFTLVELMIASSVLAIIIGSAYVALLSGYATREAIEERGDRLQRGRLAMQQLTDDLRHAEPPSEVFQFKGLNLELDGYPADVLTFVSQRWTPRLVGEAERCEVSYFIEANEDQGTKSLFRRRDPSPDLRPAEGGLREELLRGIMGLEFEYFDGYEWLDAWDEEESFPNDSISSGIVDSSGGDNSEEFSSDRTENNAGNIGGTSGLPEAIRLTLILAPLFQSTTKEKESGKPLLLQSIVRLNLTDRKFDLHNPTGDDDSPANGDEFNRITSSMDGG